MIYLLSTKAAKLQKKSESAVSVIRYTIEQLSLINKSISAEQLVKQQQVKDLEVEYESLEARRVKNITIISKISEFLNI